MLQVNYTEEAKEKINQFRYHNPDPRIQKHFEMLWLHACGIEVPEIARLTGTNPYTVRGVIKKYRDGGMEEVVKTNYHCPQSSLEQYKTSIIEEFTKRPPTTSNEAAHRIKQLFGVERFLTTSSDFYEKTWHEISAYWFRPGKSRLGKTGGIQKGNQ